MKYKRVLLKLSGEAILGDGEIIDYKKLTEICEVIKLCTEKNVQFGIVIGGGNIWRGRSGKSFDQARSDHMGMLATVINALAVLDVLEAIGVEARVATAITMQTIAEPYSYRRAISNMNKGSVMLLACGTGSPFFSTDTAAALRAAEIRADVLMKATMVDGVYDKDPKKFPDAIRYDKLSFDEVLNKNLKVLDNTASAMCKNNGTKLLVFSISDPMNIYRACMGEAIGTVVE
jgi:uridylate kinase